MLKIKKHQFYGEFNSSPGGISSLSKNLRESIFYQPPSLSATESKNLLAEYCKEKIASLHEPQIEAAYEAAMSCVLCPLNYKEKQVATLLTDGISVLKRAFNVSDQNHKNTFLKLSKQKLIEELYQRLFTLQDHYYHNPKNYPTERDFLNWRDREAHRIKEWIKTMRQVPVYSGTLILKVQKARAIPARPDGKSRNLYAQINFDGQTQDTTKVSDLNPIWDSDHVFSVFQPPACMHIEVTLFDGEFLGLNSTPVGKVRIPFSKLQSQKALDGWLALQMNQAKPKPGEAVPEIKVLLQYKFRMGSEGGWVPPDPSKDILSVDINTSSVTETGKAISSVADSVSSWIKEKTAEVETTGASSVISSLFSGWSTSTGDKQKQELEKQKELERQKELEKQKELQRIQDIERQKELEKKQKEEQKTMENPAFFADLDHVDITDIGSLIPATQQKDYHSLFDVLLFFLIQLLGKPQLNHQKGCLPEILWLLDEFLIRYGVDPTYHHLKLIELILQDFDPTKDSVEVLGAHFKRVKQFAAATVLPSPLQNLLNQIEERLRKQLQSVIQNYQDVFKIPMPQTLSLIITVYGLCHGQSDQQILPVLESDIKESFNKLMKQLNESEVTEATLLQTASATFQYIVQATAFSAEFPPKLEFMALTVCHCYECLKSAVSQYYFKDVSATPHTFPLYFKLQEIHHAIQKLIKDRVLKKSAIKLMDISRMFAKFVHEWVQETGVQAKNSAKIAIANDSYQPLRPDSDPPLLYSMSLNTLFATLNEILVSFQALEMTDNETISKFVGIIRETTDYYVGLVFDRCYEDPSYTSQKKDQERTDGFFQVINLETCVKLNNIAALAEQLEVFCKQVETRTGVRDFLNRFYVSFQIYEELIDQLVKLVVLKLNQTSTMALGMEIFLKDIPTNPQQASDPAVLKKHQTTILDYLTSNLQMLSNSLYDELFQRILQKTWSMLLSNFESLFFPLIDRKSFIQRKPLQPHQAKFFLLNLESFIDYFHSKNSGVSKALLRAEAEAITTSIQLLDAKTPELISNFQKLKEINHKNARKIQMYILSILNYHRKSEKPAVEFVITNVKDAINAAITTHFELVNEFSIFDYFYCRRIMAQGIVMEGILYVSTTRICFCLAFWDDSRISVPISEITEIKKVRLGYPFAKSILISVRNGKIYYFTSFHKRKMIVNLILAMRSNQPAKHEMKGMRQLSLAMRTSAALFRNKSLGPSSLVSGHSFKLSEETMEIKPTVTSDEELRPKVNPNSRIRELYRKLAVPGSPPYIRMYPCSTRLRKKRQPGYLFITLEFIGFIARKKLAQENRIVIPIDSIHLIEIVRKTEAELQAPSRKTVAPGTIVLGSDEIQDSKATPTTSDASNESSSPQSSQTSVPDPSTPKDVKSSQDKKSSPSRKVSAASVGSLALDRLPNLEDVTNLAEAVEESPRKAPPSPSSLSRSKEKVKNGPLTPRDQKEAEQKAAEDLKKVADEMRQVQEAPANFQDCLSLSALLPIETDDDDSVELQKAERKLLFTDVSLAVEEIVALLKNKNQREEELAKRQKLIDEGIDDLVDDSVLNNKQDRLQDMRGTVRKDPTQGTY